MKTLILTLSLLVAAPLACVEPPPPENQTVDGKRQGLWVDRDASDRKLRETEHVRNGRRHGRYREWHENGVRKLEGEYHEDNKHGSWTGFLPTGQKNSEMEYRHGVHHGFYRLCFKTTGRQSLRGYYTDGIKHGVWKTWREDGNEHKTVFYRMGKLHGNWVEKSVDRRVIARGRYCDGQRCGRLIETPDPGVRKETTFVDDREHGPALEIVKADAGFTRREMTYRHGALCGKETLYRSDTGKEGSWIEERVIEHSPCDEPGADQN